MKSLSDLVNKLTSLGLTDEQVKRILIFLMKVYIGGGSPDSPDIGIPHMFVDKEYKSEIDMLKRLELIEEHHYTGMYEFGYKCTSIGYGMAKEYILNFLKENEEKIIETLSKYPSKLVAFWLTFHCNRVQGGYFSYWFYSYGQPELPEVKKRFLKLKDDLLKLQVASYHKEDEIYIAPEFMKYLIEKADIDLGSVIHEYSVYRALTDYLRRNIKFRAQFLGILKELNLSERDIAKVLDETNALGLTSKYNKNIDPPFLILNIDKFEDFLKKRTEKTVLEENEIYLAKKRKITEIGERELSLKLSNLAESIQKKIPEINEACRLRGIEPIFKITNEILRIMINLSSLRCKNRDDFKNFIDMIYKYIYESSSNGKRLPVQEANVEEAVHIIKELRHHFLHDREHGKEREIRKKYAKIGEIYQKLIGIPTPREKQDWIKLQVSILEIVYRALLSTDRFITRKKISAT